MKYYITLDLLTSATINQGQLETQLVEFFPTLQSIIHTIIINSAHIGTGDLFKN